MALRTPLILQAQSAECGLACLAMLAGAHGHHTDLSELRRRFPVSLKGTHLSQLITHAGALGLAARALRLEPDELRALRLPCPVSCTGTSTTSWSWRAWGGAP